MLKHALLASAMLIAAPAIAQTTPADGQDKPATPATTAPTTATPPAPTTPQPTPPATTVAPTAQAAPSTPTTPAAPSTDAQAATPALADPATAATTPAPAAPAAPMAPATADAATPAAPAAAAAPTPGAQIADIVTKEFPSYDKNGDGKLNKVEFGAWMFALRKASDPALKDDAANKTYVAGAFATADTDKSKTVSKDELTNYLVQGQLAASKAS